MNISEILESRIVSYGYKFTDIKCARAIIYNKVVRIEDDMYVFGDDKYEIARASLVVGHHSVKSVKMFLKTIKEYDQKIHDGGSYKRYIGRIDEPMKIEIWFNDGAYGQSTYKLPPDDYMRVYDALEFIRIPSIPDDLIHVTR